MKLKYILPAAVLVVLAASAAIRADEDDPNDLYWKGEAYTLRSPDEQTAVKKRGHSRKKRVAPVVPGNEGQQAMKPSDSGVQAKEKPEKEGCEETMSC